MQIEVVEVIYEVGNVTSLLHWSSLLVNVGQACSVTHTDPTLSGLLMRHDRATELEKHSEVS